jgi:hypothetical protein
MTLTKALLGIIFVISSGCAFSQPSIARDTLNQPQSLFRITNPPAIYEDWWKEISDCSHVELPVDHAARTTWVIVPVRPFRNKINGVNEDAAILSESRSRDVTIYVNYTGILDRGLITHEMEHALLFWKYGQKFVGQHPAPYYTQCGLVEKGQQKL